MAIGNVKWFNNAKGWGFIEREGGPDVFVHYSQIQGEGFRTLQEGEVVQFVLKDGPKGPLAEEVRRLAEEPVAETAEVAAEGDERETPLRPRRRVASVASAVPPAVAPPAVVVAS